MTTSTAANGHVSYTAPLVFPTEHLPSAASPNLELVPATTAENFQAGLLNSSEWKGPLNLEQYIRREQHLIQQDLTKNGRITCWILTSSNRPVNPDGTRPIFAACETILKPAYVARNGNLNKALVHGICSVFTRSEYRGRGYAARMMSELGKKLETWQQEQGSKGQFSVLYSDIGEKFYTRFGWKVFPSSHIRLDPLGQDAYESTRKQLTELMKRGLPEVEDLTTNDLNSIPTIQYLEEALKVESSLHPNLPHVAVRPDVEHFAWHNARDEFQCQTLGMPFPNIKGAIHKDTGIAIVWARVFANQPSDYALNILHIAIPPARKAAPTPGDHLALAALLLRAQKEAHDWNMQAGVEVWDPSGFVVTAAKKLNFEEDAEVKVIMRDREHICSLKWNGAEPGDDESGKVMWLNNEKYAWC